PVPAVRMKLRMRFTVAELRLFVGVNFIVFAMLVDQVCFGIDSPLPCDLLSRRCLLLRAWVACKQNVQSFHSSISLSCECVCACAQQRKLKIFPGGLCGANSVSVRFGSSEF